MAKQRFSKVLLVEGNDDRYVVYALCEKFSLEENFEVVDCKGINRLLAQLPTRFKESGIDTVGLIIDADTDLNGRWQSIEHILRPIFPNFPHELNKNGLIHSNQDGMKVGVWIMPNNNLNGMLEDFLHFLIPKVDKLLPFVEGLLQKVEAQNIQEYHKQHHTKAKIHSWLALQEDPGTPLGLSITKKYLTTDDEVCQIFISWLDNLFK